MKQRALGQDGLKVSAIGFGCMSFGGFYGDTSIDESFAALDAAWDAGVTFLDVAEIYGRGKCEQIIGDWQKDRGRQFHIATKGGIVIGGARGENDNSEAGLRKALEGSLARLQVDHVALYYVHRRQQDIPIEDVVQTLCKFRDEGKIGGFGFSEIAPSSLRRAASVAPVMAVQNEYSLWTRYPDLGLIQTCQQLGTTFVPFSPLARGMLSDTIPDPTKFVDGDFRKGQPRFLPPNFAPNVVQIKRIQAYARDHGWSTAALAMAWVLDRDPGCIPIPGTRTAAHLLEWAAGADITLTDTHRAEIDAILPVGWAHGDRYSDAQLAGIERYC